MSQGNKFDLKCEPVNELSQSLPPLPLQCALLRSFLLKCIGKILWAAIEKEIVRFFWSWGMQNKKQKLLANLNRNKPSAPITPSRNEAFQYRCIIGTFQTCEYHGSLPKRTMFTVPSVQDVEFRRLWKGTWVSMVYRFFSPWTLYLQAILTREDGRSNHTTRHKLSFASYIKASAKFCRKILRSTAPCHIFYQVLQVWRRYSVLAKEVEVAQRSGISESVSPNSSFERR